MRGKLRFTRPHIGEADQQVTWELASDTVYQYSAGNILHSRGLHLLPPPTTLQILLHRARHPSMLPITRLQDLQNGLLLSALRELISSNDDGHGGVAA